jgi:hypothetical protein
MQAHPSHKNKNVARVGHPRFHPLGVGSAGGRLTKEAERVAQTGGKAAMAASAWPAALFFSNIFGESQNIDTLRAVLRVWTSLKDPELKGRRFWLDGLALGFVFV